jgi:hypothetical protein
MKVKGPTSPLSGGAEALESLNPAEARQRSAIGEKFAAALSQLEAQGAGEQSAAGASRSALAEIAGGADLGSPEGAASAVRESARYMIRSRLHEDFRDTEQGARMVTELSDYVASDPQIKAKLLSILQRIKAR